MTTKTSGWLRMVVPCAAVALLAACGGGSSASSPSATTYQLNATAGAGGSISPATASVDAGGTAKFTVTPASGYVVSGATGCGGTLAGNTYTTGMVNGNCTVTATFIAQYALTAMAGTGGAISPASATVNSGGTTTFTVTANSGYAVSGVTGCGGTLAGDTYTTGTINAACAVIASFSVPFTWIGGPDSEGAQGTYGAQGVAAATNIPGARDSGVTWMDAGGNLWLFGGGGLDSKRVFSFLNDLWKYSPSSGEWTWMGGSDTVGAAGIYGTEGVAAATSVPGARDDATARTDASGNFWLFGGLGNDSTGLTGMLNDLWEYSPSSGEWTWVSGSNTMNAAGLYGTEGVASATSVPGARDRSVSWTDAGGNFWLFGGFGYDSRGTFGHQNDLNDLWKYSPASGEWTWVSGSNIGNASGVYGTRGIAAAANIPGARDSADVWTDANGNVWLLGGLGYDSAGQLGVLNDLWEYSPATGEWTWMSGSNLVNASGVYGALGVAAAANAPGAHSSASVWMGARGNLWLFGGYGYDSTGQTGKLNDLWEYSPATGEWTWVGGSSTVSAAGIYGTRNVAAAANVPGARYSAAVWTDGTGNMWLFGGVGFDSTGTVGELSDLWEYTTQ